MAERTELEIIVRIKDLMTATMKRIGGTVQKFKSNMVKAFSDMRNSVRQFVTSIFGIAAAFLVIRRSITDLFSFRKAMSEVSTIVDTSVVSMQALSAAVLDLAVAQGVNETLIARGLYQTISADITDVSDALLFLEQASKLAVAGVSTTEEAVKLLTSAINPYKIAMEDVGGVSDIFFKTVERGSNTIPQLANAMGRILGPAKEMGASLIDVSAAVATITQTQLTVNETVTGLKAIFTAFVSKQEVANKVLGDTQQILGSGVIAAKGFSRAIIELSEAVAGDSGKLQELLGSVEAVNAVIALTGDNTEGFRDRILDLTEAMDQAGALTQDRFERQMADPARKVQTAFNALRVGALELSDVLVVGMVKSAEAIDDTTESTDKLRKSMKSLEPVAETIIALFSAFATGLTTIAFVVTGVAALMAQLGNVMGLVSDKSVEKMNKAVLDLADSLETQTLFTREAIKNIIDFGDENERAALSAGRSKDALDDQSDALKRLADEAAATAAALAALEPQLRQGFSAEQIEGHAKVLAFMDRQRQIQILQLSGQAKEIAQVEARALAEIGRWEVSRDQGEISQRQFMAFSDARLGALDREILKIQARDGASTGARDATGSVSIAVQMVTALGIALAKTVAQKLEFDRLFGPEAFGEGFKAGLQDVTNFLGNQFANGFEIARDSVISFRDGLGGAFADFATGAKSAGDAMKQFAANFVTSLIQIVTQAVATSLVLAALGFFGINPQALGFDRGGVAAGGIEGLAKGGVIDHGLETINYAGGGPIVRHEHLARVGEGHFNEAVVPLPDGRAIPVDMRGGPGMGDINVNISAIDARGIDELLFQKSDQFKAIMAQAIMDSPAFRGQIRGDRT